MIKSLKNLLLLAVFAGTSSQAIAANIYPIIHGTGSFRQMVIEGVIAHGDFDKFIKIVEESQGKMSGIYLFSSGGDFDEAMKIGRAMRALELSSAVPMRDERTDKPVCNAGNTISPKPKDPKNCIAASAAFFIHIGSIHRSGTFLAVHRPYFVQGKFGALSEDEAKKAFDELQSRARAYMEEMGVPKHIQEDVLGTPSDSALILDDKTIKTYFWTELPSRHEWVKNRCDKMTTDEKTRLDSYYQTLLENRASANDKPTDLDTLTKKETDQRNCHVKLIVESRLAAYTKYFRKLPSDTENHDFSKWSEATKYLGKNYDDILSEEKFEESKGNEITFLTRDAAANAPFIQLSDTTNRISQDFLNAAPEDDMPEAVKYFKKHQADFTANTFFAGQQIITASSPLNSKVVASIVITSIPHPSDMFIQKLTNSLNEAWGKPTGGNRQDTWIWSKDTFTAKLTKVTLAEGLVWVAYIDAKAAD